MSINPLKIGTQSTKASKLSLFRQHIEPHLEMKTFSEDDLFNLIDIWEQKDLKPGTIRQLLRLTKKLVEYYTGNNIDISNIIKTFNESAPIIKSWKREEIKKAFNVARHLDYELYEMMLVTLHTGIRKGELFGLTWEDIDFFYGKIKIWKSLTRYGLKSVKNRQSRIIPMTEAVENILQNRYTVGEEDKHCFVYCDPNERLKKICELAKVRSITWHGLRHTFATLALENPGPNRSPKDVQIALGHSKLSTTLDYYWDKVNGEINLEFLND